MGGETAWGMVKHRFLGSGECFGRLVRDLKGMKLEEKSGEKTCEWTPRDKEKVYRSLCLSLMSHREHFLQKRLSTVRRVDRFTHPSQSPAKPLQWQTMSLKTEWPWWQEWGLWWVRLYQVWTLNVRSANNDHCLCPCYSTIPQGHHPGLWCQVDYITPF